MALSLRQMFEKYERGQTDDLNDYFLSVADPAADPATLAARFADLQHCVSFLGRDLDAYVRATFKVTWAGRDARLSAAYRGYVVHLVSAHSYHLQLCVASLVSSFAPAAPPGDVAAREAAYGDAHALLRAVVRIVPLAPAVILRQLSALYPHRTRAPHTQTCFLQNALHVTTYLPALRGDVVAIVVARMLQIDALLTQRDVDEMRARSVATTTPDDNDQIFEMEELHVADTKLQTSDKGQLFACLDDLMYVMFAYIHATCWQLNGDEETLNWKAALSLYRELAAAFRRVVLPTHESSHVQYLAFYICSFRPTLADAFLDLLWKGFLDVNASAVARQNCAAYAASLLVRARYVAAATVRTVLTAMAAWIHRYIDGGVDALARPDRAAHLAFYAACQALFYVVAFRHEELARSPGGHAWLRSLNLQRVVTCQLNPLAVCPSAVVLQFASVTRALQIAYCYTVVEHNARNTIPVARDSRASLADALASFFPFEPYVLPKSRRFVATPTLYREFKLSKPDAEKGRKKMEEEDGEEGEEEDDFLHYGSSPGFKRAHLALSPPLLCDMAMSL